MDIPMATFNEKWNWIKLPKYTLMYIQGYYSHDEQE